MKENRKLLKEVLKDIRHDMTDEEVLNLLADSKISVSPEKEKEKLGVYIFLYRWADPVDGHQHDSCVKSVWRISVYPAEPCPVLRCSHSGTADHDESEPTGGKRPPAC